MSGNSWTLTQDSSPVMILVRRELSARSLAKFSSCSLTLNYFCSSFSSLGMNFGQSFDIFRSVLRMVLTAVPLKFRCWERSEMVQVCSVSTAAQMHWMFSAVLAVLGLPDLLTSFTESLPSAKVLCQLHTAVFEKVLPPNTACSLHQVWVGVAPDFCINLMTDLCSSHFSISKHNRNNRNKWKPKLRTLKCGDISRTQACCRST